MTQRHKRGFINKEEALSKLKKGRDGAIQIRTQAKIGSTEYEIAGELVKVIDQLAKQLTGNETHFYTTAAGTPPRNM